MLLEIIKTSYIFDLLLLLSDFKTYLAAQI